MNTRIPSLLPEQFGPLQGIRILSTGSLIAQPYAATLAAEMGAEVIQVERPGEGDAAWRHLGRQLPTIGGKGKIATTWIQERRNEFYIALDMSKREGQDLFVRLVKCCDIWMESSKPGSYSKWGLTDDVVLQANPQIIITHVSGYGQSGHPDYLGRASYDMIGQAFGGLMHQTGFPDPDPPVRANPWTADYITALFCLWSSLAGYIYAQRTGKGQVIDVSQFEAIHRLLSGTMVEYFADGFVRGRSGNKATAFQPYDAFQAQDGWVVIGAVGLAVFSRVCAVLGLDPKEPKWQAACTDINSPEGIEFDALLRGWVAERPVKEVVDTMNAAQVACCRIMTAKNMADDPHYQARNVHVEWEDGQAGKVKGTGITPMFSVSPGKIWRGSVPVGHDNDRIYKELAGLTDQDLSRLKKEGVI